MRLTPVIVLTAALVTTAAAIATAQSRYRGEEPVPDQGMVGLGVSVGAAPASEPSFATGVDVTGNIEGYLSRRLSVRGQISGAWWDITGRAFNGTARPLILDGNFVYNFEGGRIHPFLTGGVGLYRYNFSETPTTGVTTKPGVDVGGGMEYFVHRHTTVTAEILFHGVSSPLQSPVTTYSSSEFWTATIGMKKYFSER